MLRPLIRTLLIIALLPITLHLLPGQADSLRAVVADPPNDTADLNALLALVRIQVAKDRDDALALSREMLQRARRRDRPEWTALACRTVGVMHWLAGRLDSCRHYYEAGLDALGEPADHPKVGIGLLVNMGAYHQINAELDEAVRYFARAYELAESSGYTQDVPKILNNLGALYRRIGRYESARRAYEQAVRLKEEGADSLSLAASLANLGKVQVLLDEPAAADRTLARAKTVYAAIGRVEEVASVDVMRGVAQYMRGEGEAGRQTILTALDDDELEMEPLAMAQALFAVAESYRDEGNDEQALRFLRQGKPFALASGVKDIAANYERAFGRVYQGLGRDAEASASFANFSSAIDTVMQQQRLATQSETAESFQAQLREAEIERQQLVIEQQRQGQRLLWLGLSGLALLFLFITLYLRSRLKVQRSEAKRLETERTAELQRLQQEKEVSNLRAMVEGQEAERRRVAKDLHDGLGGLLATVKARMSATAVAAPEANRMIDRACTEVRRIAHNMMPQTLALSGLSESVRDLVVQLNARGLDTELEIIGQPDLRLDEEGQAMLLRIIQELTHNAVKHAEADKLFVQLLDQPTQLLLTVEDDGKGFDPARIGEKPTGLGLASIEARATYLRGELQYDSSPGHGTTVTLTIPL